MGIQLERKQKGYAMSSKTMKNAVVVAAGALGFAGAVAIATASPSWAAPVLQDMAAIKTAASNQVTDVQYHHRGYYGRGYGRGYYGRGYYGQGYYPRRGYYGYPYRRYGYPNPYYSYPYGNYSYAYPYAYPYPYAYGFGFGW